MKTREEVRKQIETDYSWWIAEHTHKPNVAYVKIKWFDCEEPETNLETIVLDEEEYFDDNGNVKYPYIDDEDVLYYVSGITELLNLTDEEDNSSDFEVVEFVGFERLK